MAMILRVQELKWRVDGLGIVIGNFPVMKTTKILLVDDFFEYRSTDRVKVTYICDVPEDVKIEDLR